MSEFHRNWQEIFPNKNIKYKIEKNKPYINTKITFGKYSGNKLVDIPTKYLLWLKENRNNKFLKNCRLYEDIKYVLRYSIADIIKHFMSIYEHDGIRYFDYTFTDFAHNYNKKHGTHLLLQINNNKLCNEDFNTRKYHFIDE